MNNPAPQACAIVGFASLAALISLLIAENRSTCFATIRARRVLGILLVLLAVIAALAAYMWIHFGLVEKRWLMLKWFEEDEVRVVYVWAAVAIALLPWLIWLTGGPTQSWFTSFLLVVVPLMSLLRANDKSLLGKYALVAVAFYCMTMLLELKWPSKCTLKKNGEPGHFWYQLCYGVFVVIAGTFVTVVELSRS